MGPVIEKLLHASKNCFIPFSLLLCTAGGNMKKSSDDEFDKIVWIADYDRSVTVGTGCSKLIVLSVQCSGPS